MIGEYGRGMNTAGRPLLWSDDDDATLRALWAEGHSTAEIGRRMHRTKSSVCGRAGRTNCPPRVNVLTNTQVLVRKASVKKPRVELVLKMPPLLQVKPVGKRSCQFPMWGLGRATGVYCDAPTGRIYCAAHAARCYVPARGPVAAVAA